MIARRRMLAILAGVAGLPALPPCASAKTSAVDWRGVALGAEARIILHHPAAETLVPGALAELRRLENIFSLYRADSDLSRLNRDGVLPSPALELVELLSLCGTLNHRTQGAFDPTMQPLWSLYARRFSDGRAPDDDEIARTRSLTGWREVEFSSRQIRYRRRGMQMTLNGIAQGYIADRIAAFFRHHGVSDMLIHTGEIAALGVAPDDEPWRVKLINETGSDIPVSDAAVATSAPLGTTFDEAGTVGHIIDPRNGRAGGRWSAVSVVARSAAEADGLSTAFCLMDRAQIMAASGECRIWLDVGLGPREISSTI